MARVLVAAKSWAILLCLAGSYGTLHGQEKSGTIQGTVTDSTGAAIAGAKIRAVTTDGRGSFETATTSAGYYVFGSVPIGTYSVTASYVGFATSRQNVEVTLGSVINFSPQLRVGAMAEKVIVSSVDLLAIVHIGVLSPARSADPGTIK